MAHPLPGGGDLAVEARLMGLTGAPTPLADACTTITSNSFCKSFRSSSMRNLSLNFTGTSGIEGAGVQGYIPCVTTATLPEPG